MVNNQNGFCEKHSSCMALLKLVDDISNEVNNKIDSMGIFVDLSKTFDTINHYLLMKKHQHCGVTGIVLDLFVNYLENRSQYVKIYDTNSALLNVSCGVPKNLSWVHFYLLFESMI